MKGLEPLTFCMASVRIRSLWFAPVRIKGGFCRVFLNAADGSERE
jgi:hypothetical protein